MIRSALTGILAYSLLTFGNVENVNASLLQEVPENRQYTLRLSDKETLLDFLSLFNKHRIKRANVVFGETEDLYRCVYQFGDENNNLIFPPSFRNREVEPGRISFEVKRGTVLDEYLSFLDRLDDHRDSEGMIFPYSVEMAYNHEFGAKGKLCTLAKQLYDSVVEPKRIGEELEAAPSEVSSDVDKNKFTLRMRTDDYGRLLRVMYIDRIKQKRTTSKEVGEGCNGVKAGNLCLDRDSLNIDIEEIMAPVDFSFEEDIFEIVDGSTETDFSSHRCSFDFGNGWDNPPRPPDSFKNQKVINLEGVRVPALEFRVEGNLEDLKDLRVLDRYDGNEDGDIFGSDVDFYYDALYGRDSPYCKYLKATAAFNEEKKKLSTDLRD